MKKKELAHSLKVIATNSEASEILIQALVQIEGVLKKEGLDVRETITGPVVDCLYNDDTILEKSLIDGTKFEFYYRSKIARDFLMSTPRTPDHAWEPQTTRLLLDLSKKSKNVIVGGAYFGDQAILIAKQISLNGGFLHAFEPNNQQRLTLRKNAQINGLTNIKTSGDGLWNNSTTKLKLTGYDSFATPEVADEKNKDTFKTITIEDYVVNEELPGIDLLMLDIEGAEFKALLGAENLLKKAAGEAPNVVLEVHSHYVDWSNGLNNTPLIRYLNDCGYHTFAVRDFHSNYSMSDKTIEIIPSGEVYLKGPDHGFNMLAIKDMGIVQNERYRFCSNVSPKLLPHRDPKLYHPTTAI